MAVKYSAQVRAKVDRRYRKGKRPSDVARELSLPARYVYSRYQWLGLAAARDALAAQEGKQ